MNKNLKTNKKPASNKKKVITPRSKVIKSPKRLGILAITTGLLCVCAFVTNVLLTNTNRGLVLGSASDIYTMSEFINYTPVVWVDGIGKHYATAHWSEMYDIINFEVILYKKNTNTNKYDIVERHNDFNGYKTSKTYLFISKNTDYKVTVQAESSLYNLGKTGNYANAKTQIGYTTFKTKP